LNQGKWTNFFEWGIKCDELETNSVQSPGVSPIVSISFTWSTVQPDSVTYTNSENINRTRGVGQCTFEMYHSQNKCNIQDAFKMQTVLKEVEFIRFINDGGRAVENERYIFQDVTINSYHFESRPDQGTQKDIISITSKGDQRYIQTIQENGKSVGKKVTRLYNAQQGIR